MCKVVYVSLEVVLFVDRCFFLRGTYAHVYTRAVRKALQHEAAIYPRHTATLRSSPCEALVIPGPAQSKLVGAA